jgi:hypothetical protein
MNIKRCKPLFIIGAIVIALYLIFIELFADWFPNPSEKPDSK